MIEIVYKENKEQANGNEGYFHLPKNIRQVGDTNGRERIYLEDYVGTFLKKYFFYFSGISLRGRQMQLRNATRTRTTRKSPPGRFHLYYFCTFAKIYRLITASGRPSNMAIRYYNDDCTCLLYTSDAADE